MADSEVANMMRMFTGTGRHTCHERWVRFASFSRGTVALTEYVRKSKSLLEAHCGLHAVVTKTDGFIQYQIDLMLAHYCIHAKQPCAGLVERAFVAGPGMLKVALDVAFSEHFLDPTDDAPPIKTENH